MLVGVGSFTLHGVRAVRRVRPRGLSRGHSLPRRVLLARKTSRLEYERMRYSHLTDDQLKEKLAAQGSDYAGLLRRHDQHSRSVEQIITRLQEHGVDLLVKDKEGLCDADVQWADLILAAGGDGNFLRTASKVLSQHKRLVGINTDPRRSEGHLCIRPTPTLSPGDVVDCVLRRQFKELYRQRIRVRLAGQVLPHLVLNEAFIGEIDPSHMCYHELSCDGRPAEKQRSSGVLIYTGTGSTSWACNVHRLSTAKVHNIISIAVREGMLPESLASLEATERVARLYNQQSVFPSDDTRVAFVVREPIAQGVLASSCTSGYCRSVEVRSRSWNSRLIIDGQVTHDLPNGAVAHFSVNPEDALSTALLLQE